MDMEYRKHIHGLDDDSLLQVFSCYRLEEEDNWYLRSSWQNLVQVCRRWRYLAYKSPSHLDLCLLLTNNSPSIHTPNHLPHLPLVIYHSDRTGTTIRRDDDNIHLGLQQHHGRVRQVVLQAPSLSLSMWLESMDKVFPRLNVLSLLSTTIEETNLMLPETLQAPDLRSLVLHGIGLPRGLTLLSSSIALSTITLTHIGVSCYFTPGQLVTKLQILPHLEELSFGFAISIPLPSSENNLLPAPIPPVTLPALRRLTFRGLDIYLDNLVAQINSPLLERLSLTLPFDLAFTLVNLTEFIHRTKVFESLVARIIFNNNGAFIDFGKVNLYVNCEPLDWKIDSATQFCSTLRKVLYIVEELTVDLNKDGLLSGWEKTLDSVMWHELLLPFIGVKRLCIGTSIALELSKALGSVAGGLVFELLPDLQGLVVDINTAENALSGLTGYLKTRAYVGLPVNAISVHPHRLGSARQQGSGPMTAPWTPSPMSPIQDPAGGANAFGGSYLHQSAAPNAFRGSHSQQSVNNEPYHIGFIHPSNAGPNRLPRPQNTSRGPHPAGRARKRKAVVIGTNYSTHPDHRFKLRYCIEDAYGMANFICSNLGFESHDVRLMTDEADDPQNLPTKDNILSAMRALVYDAQPGNTFFFYFSGHSVQIKDLDGDEADGQDECICAIDYRGNVPNPNPNTPGLIVDDVIHDILVRPLPRGCRLTALFDSCHSGTALDLPFQYDSHGLVNPVAHPGSLWLLRQKASHADVVSLSASRDGQKSRETRLGGALRCAFIECVRTTSRALTYKALLLLVHEYLKRRGFPQRLQLSTSHEINTDNTFVT